MREAGVANILLLLTAMPSLAIMTPRKTTNLNVLCNDMETTLNSMTVGTEVDLGLLYVATMTGTTHPRLALMEEVDTDVLLQCVAAMTGIIHPHPAVMEEEGEEGEEANLNLGPEPATKSLMAAALIITAISVEVATRSTSPSQSVFIEKNAKRGGPSKRLQMANTKTSDRLTNQSQGS